MIGNGQVRFGGGRRKRGQDGYRADRPPYVRAEADGSKVDSVVCDVFTRDERVGPGVEGLRFMLSFTWDTVVPALQERIDQARRIVRDCRELLPPEKADGAEASLRERLLAPLEGLVPVVHEMRSRPEFQSLSPVISHEYLNLMWADRRSFWIRALGQGRFQLLRWPHTEPGAGLQPVCEDGMSEVLESLRCMLIRP